MNQVKKKGEVETKLETFVNNAFESIHGKMPDFKVCTQNYTVENNPKWSVGHTDEWAYKSKDEILDEMRLTEPDLAKILERENPLPDTIILSDID